jgi:hypothetical protein
MILATHRDPEQRIGGPLGVPFDYGGAELESAPPNPVVRVDERVGGW